MLVIDFGRITVSGSGESQKDPVIPNPNPVILNQNPVNPNPDLGTNNPDPGIPDRIWSISLRIRSFRIQNRITSPNLLFWHHEECQEHAGFDKVCVHPD